MAGNKYYVYHVLLEDEVVYVGKGCGDRYKHPLSGKSHNKYLNELYFRHSLLEEAIANVVKVRDNLEEDVAYRIEREYIQDLLPKGNVQLKQPKINSSKKAPAKESKKVKKEAGEQEDTLIELPNNYENFKQYIQYLYDQKEDRCVSIREFVKSKKLNKSWKPMYSFIDNFLEVEPKGYKENGGHNSDDWADEKGISVASRNAFTTWRSRRVKTQECTVEDYNKWLEKHIKRKGEVFVFGLEEKDE